MMAAAHHPDNALAAALPRLAIAPTSSISGLGLSKVTLLELSGPSARTPDSMGPSDEGNFVTPLSVSVRSQSQDHFQVPDLSLESCSSFTSTTQTRRSSRSRTRETITGSSISRLVPVHSVRVVDLESGSQVDRHSVGSYPSGEQSDDEDDDDGSEEGEPVDDTEPVEPTYKPPPVIPRSSLRKIKREEEKLKKNGQPKTKSKKKFWKRRLCVIQ